MGGYFGKNGGGGGAVDGLFSYDKETDRIVAKASLQVKPSSVFLGPDFGMSNAVQAVGFKLADGTDALGLVNRFDKDGGSYSNPRFFALGSAETLVVNSVDTVVMQAPIEVSYTTAGDNLTYSFEIKPATAGRLRAQYWLGDDDSGTPVVDFHRDITKAEVDSNQPILVEPNFYVLAKSSKLFVRFTGINLNGNGTQPWFRSKVLPFKEVQFSGHCEYMTANTPNTQLYIGGTYFADAAFGNVLIDVKQEFRDTFTIVDFNKNFIGTRYAEVDFSASGQRKVRLVNPGDHVEFFRMKVGVENELWYYLNHRDGSIVRIPLGTGIIGTTPEPNPESQAMRGMGVFPSSDLPVVSINHRNFTAKVQVRTNLVVLNIEATERMRYSGLVINGSQPFTWEGVTAGIGLQVAIINVNSLYHHGRLLLSTVGAPTNHVTLSWDMHYNDSDEYAYFVKLE